ncbi:Ubiquitin-like modifier-activating enzyme [Venturia nashicola]|uniref:Protein SDS23 n=1 Tax=Venturia nashicola TaxID=86259 RepID=A0A4Z1NIA0_9PEZI|nr:Ubiquitin-like modifier-activating enzyme [Venturia nashicola]TLD20089.1 Ubiquitin-like modifier-activating enzyme [Venturia nashicola]
MADNHNPPPPGPHTPAPLQTSRSPPNSSTRPPPSPSLASISHRPSLTENLRANPTSPRAAYRSPSLSQHALQELMNNPPTMNSSEVGLGKSGKIDFAGRDWRDVKVGEVVDEDLVRWVEMDTSVEEATNVLITSGSPNVVLLRESKDTHAAIGTFDYADLNSYLLLVVGLAQPEDRQSFKELAQKGREGRPIPLKDVKDLGKKEPLIVLPHTASLTKAAEVFGSGIHRLIVVKEGTQEVVGVLTQLRMVTFFWENGRHFESIEGLYQATLRELDIGSKEVFAINGDKPLTDALELMNNEGITSLPVVDHQQNVIGNISHVDVRLLTKNTALPLLRSSCIHFISVILSERGVTDGKDSYPVFHVSPFSTLAHTTAKLVATRSHRMWVVQPSSPASSSGPPTPALAPTTPLHASSSFSSQQIPTNLISSTTIPPPATPPIAASTTSQIQSGMQYSQNMSGHLSGVVSLTDILNLFAKASGLNPHDPSELRQLRRRSSSASNTRRSISSARSESIGGGSSVAGSRRGSQSNRRPIAQGGSGGGGGGSAIV